MSHIKSQYSLFDILTFLDTVLQIADFDLNTRQSSNDDIMKALQEQNSKYLNQIIENQNKILNILSGKDMSAK